MNYYNVFWQTRNARKACPQGVSLPEWILKSREIGTLLTVSKDSGQHDATELFIQ